MVSNVEEQLNQEIDNFPSRASGEDLYEHINKISNRLIRDSREDFITAMAHWLQLRSEPKTMLAVTIIGENHLVELKEDLEELLDDVEKGKTFKPFYERPINKSLRMI
jgi:hypothetical protein